MSRAFRDEVHADSQTSGFSATEGIQGTRETQEDYAFPLLLWEVSENILWSSIPNDTQTLSLLWVL